jgi:hypothetical protein
VKDLKDWWPIIVGAVLAGIWLGNLQGRVANLEQQHDYEHGTYAVPSQSKGQ